MGCGLRLRCSDTKLLPGPPYDVILRIVGARGKRVRDRLDAAAIPAELLDAATGMFNVPAQGTLLVRRRGGALVLLDRERVLVGATALLPRLGREVGFL